jgi:uncharacterized protein YjbI with pentapeptide repeats
MAHNPLRREECKVDQNPNRRESSLIRELVPDWRPSRGQVLWTIRIALVLVFVLGILTLVGLPFNITLWQWLDLLFIPVVLAIGGYLFTRSENRATRGAAGQRAQDEALQAYLDQIGQLLLEKNLRNSEDGSEVRTLARARTLTVLQRLDSGRKRSVLQFLYESGLLAKDSGVFDLTGADLRKASLNEAVLSKADLHGADLSNAALRNAKLREAYLVEAILSESDLSRANLVGADLSGSDLSRADLDSAWLLDANLGESTESALTEAYRPTSLAKAILRRADLQRADLSGADLSGADLSGADLREADLRAAVGVTEEQLVQARSLEGATMPDGQKYGDWLKGRGEDRENSGTS